MNGCQSSPKAQGQDTEEKVERSSTENTDSQKSTSHSKDPSFARYLQFFSDVYPLDRWPEDALDHLVIKGEIWLEDKTELDFVLNNYYHEIDPILYRHIPTRKLIGLTKDAPAIPNPLSRYDFYAFAKVKQGANWLVSMLALKREMEQEAYHQHAFLLATYSPDGLPLDDYIWWTITDDDLQVCDNVDVSGDTLLVGKKESLHRRELDEVYEKVVVTTAGKFRYVYQHFPDGYLGK